MGIHTACIYILREPGTGQIRYVGRASQHFWENAQRALTRRRACHSFTPKGDMSPRSEWIRELRARGERPLIELVEAIPAAEADHAEQRWLAYLRARGESLVNNERPRRPTRCAGCGAEYP
jgi:hypothetical protein